MQRVSPVGHPSHSPANAREVTEMRRGGPAEPFPSLRETLTRGLIAAESRPAAELPLVPAAPPLGFNCPACGVVLVVQAREAYDGGPAPCPQCRAQILPPRVVTVPFEWIDLHPLPGLSERGEFRAKTPRALHRSDRHPQRLVGATEDFEGLLASL